MQQQPDQDFEMSMWQALKVLRRYNKVPRQQCRLLESLVLADKPLPLHLNDLLEKVWLMQLRRTQRLH